MLWYFMRDPKEPLCLVNYISFKSTVSHHHVPGLSFEAPPEAEAKPSVFDQEQIKPGTPKPMRVTIKHHKTQMPTMRVFLTHPILGTPMRVRIQRRRQMPEQKKF